MAKRSEHELKRLVEAAVADVCGLPRPGLWFGVEAVESFGHPPSYLRVWATLHFLPSGAPFCCTEPGCHLVPFGERLAEVGEHVRRAMRLEQSVTVELGDGIAVHVHPGVSLHGDDLVEQMRKGK